MWIAFALAIIAILVLAFRGFGFLAWTGAAAILLLGWRVQGVASPSLFMAVTTGLILLALVFGLPPLRRALISRFVMPVFAKVLPRLGDTERVALEAGTVWWDADLFSGMPDWQKLLDFEARPLSDDEQAFLDGPVNELCAAIDDWQVYQDRDLPPEVWALIRKHRLFGLIIPKDEAACRIRVDSEIIPWAPGKVFVFDDTFEHEVWNDTEEERVILLFDFDRPMKFWGRFLNGTFLQLMKMTAFYKDPKRNLADAEARLESAIRNNDARLEAAGKD